MNTIAQLVRDYEQARQRCARPELLRRLKDRIEALKAEASKERTDLQLEDKDSFETVFKEVMEELNRHCLEGTTDYIREHHLELHYETVEAERRVDKAWQDGLDGKVTAGEFRKVVVEWYELFLRGIEVFSQSVDRRAEPQAGGV